jgi:yecA family protein
MSYRELQGFLFAVAAAPDMVPPSNWIPVVLGEQEPAFDSGAQAQRLLGDLMALYNKLNSEVFANTVKLPKDCRFRDDVLSNLSDDAPVSQWCRGFVRGHSWLKESWDETVPDELDDELAALAITMSFFASRRLAEQYLAECSDRGKTLVDLAETFREVFPDAMARYAHLGRSIHQVLTSRQSRFAEKIGRNDPCPCGSGKKYKRCCLAAPADLLEQAARQVRRIQGDVEPRVVRFLHSLCGPGAIDRAWGEFACGYDDLEPDGPECQLFQPWLLYGWIPEIPGRAERSNTRSVAQLYLDDHAARLTPEEARFIQTTCDTPISFHDVVRVESGRRLRLRDILLQTEHEVFEQSASEMLRVGDVVYGRVVPYEKVTLIIGMGAVPLPPIEKRGPIRIRERLRKDFGEPTAAMILASAEQLRKLYLGVRDKLMNPAPPVLNNTDNEPIEFHTITCGVESIEAAFDALAPLAKGAAKEELLQDASFDADGRLKRVEFPWLKKGNKKHSSWENTVLGHVLLEGAKLTADVNSAARARRLQKEMRKRLGPTMRNLTVAIKPIDEAFSDQDRIRDTPEEQKQRMEEARWRASPEAREAMRQIQEQQWEEWIDDKIPALDGLTPREAVRRSDAREMVEALLLQFERHGVEAGEDAYDFNRLRRKLGLRTREIQAHTDHRRPGPDLMP